MEMKVIVLGMSRYQFVNSETGEMIEGTKVHYVEVKPEVQKDNCGVIPQTANMPLEFYENMNKDHVPGVYNAHLSISLRGKKPVLRLTAFDYIAPVDLAKIADRQAARV